MALYIATGQATSLDGHEAALQATRQALSQLDQHTPSFGLVAVSAQFPIQPVLNGITALLGDTPLLGWSTPSVLTQAGPTLRSVAILLISLEDWSVQAGWWPWNSDTVRNDTIAKLTQGLELNQAEGTLFVIGDGLQSNPRQLCQALPSGSFLTLGGLSSAELHQASTGQIGGKQAGQGGVAAALLDKTMIFAAGAGQAHVSTGRFFKITQASVTHIQMLDDQTAAAAFASVFGYGEKDWCKPPLNTLVRLYPLGVEQPGRAGLDLHAPLCMESDGSLHMTSPVAPGSIGHVMVGSPEACLEAIRSAARQARQGLGEIPPCLGLILVDRAWQTMLEAQPGAEVEALRSVVGDIPILGGYTYGQILGQAHEKSSLLEQHALVILGGSA